MRKPGLTAVGLGLIGIGSSLFASPASAAISCGTAPTGGTLTQSGDYCQLVFDVPGDYTATIPTSANQLFALVVGGGGDYYGPYEYYAGNAGKVTYGDLTGSIGNELSIHIGAGGDGDDTVATSGNDSSVSDPVMSNYAIAFGGSMATQPGPICTVPGFDGHLTSAGAGARTVSNMNTSTNSCVGAEGSGVNPAHGDVDSDGHAAPAIFSNMDETFGTGGFVTDSMSTYSHMKSYGDGADFVVDPTTDTVTTTGDGANGAAILRWRHILANTGGNTGELSALAITLMTLGAGLTVASRIRRRVSK